ncbi:hypothetical protein N9045_01820 [bacterium]|nr:hypothetical protein [bacterium]
MKMIEIVQEAFEDKEPGKGGYGSEFRFREHPEGAIVELEAEWAPRHCTPSCLVTGVCRYGKQVTFQFLERGEPDGTERVETVEELAEWLSDQASGA